MSQQQFDWKHSPANNLRRALQQAQLSLEEISENKFLESSLRDLLKRRIAPAYLCKFIKPLFEKYLFNSMNYGNMLLYLRNMHIVRLEKATTC